MKEEELPREEYDHVGACTSFSYHVAHQFIQNMYQHSESERWFGERISSPFGGKKDPDGEKGLTQGSNDFLDAHPTSRLR